jgi:hypothetical protein
MLEGYDMIKRYRIYFNRMADWPQVWSVDEGTQVSEVNVIAVHLFVSAETKLGSKAHLGSDDYPAVWIECRGVLRLNGGVAEISLS